MKRGQGCPGCSLNEPGLLDQLPVRLTVVENDYRAQLLIDRGFLNPHVCSCLHLGDNLLEPCWLLQTTRCWLLTRIPNSVRTSRSGSGGSMQGLGGSSLLHFHWDTSVPVSFSEGHITLCMLPTSLLSSLYAYCSPTGNIHQAHVATP